MKRKIPVLKIILILWVIFSVAYVAYGEWTRFNIFVMQKSYQKGMSDAVVQVVQRAQDCKAFPVTIGDQGVNLINVACLQQTEAVEPAQPVE